MKSLHESIDKILRLPYLPTATASKKRSKRMSKTSCVTPVVGCLELIENVIGSDGIWHTNNRRQREFIENRARVGSVRSLNELKGCASRRASEVNAFTKEEGFPDVHLDDLGNANSMYVASILKLLTLWLTPGTKCQITTQDGAFPGVWLNESDAQVSFFEPHRWDRPVACIPTKSGDMVYLAKMDQTYAHELLDSPLVRFPSLSQSTGRHVSDFNGVQFPMVTLDQMVDLSWIQGMSTSGSDGLPAIIAQAKQQTKFRMNLEGANVESASAMSMRVGAAPGLKRRSPLIINEPFLIWIHRPSLLAPLFAGHMTPEDWKDPGTL